MQFDFFWRTQFVFVDQISELAGLCAVSLVYTVMKRGTLVFNKVKENDIVLLRWSVMSVENVQPAFQETALSAPPAAGRWCFAYFLCVFLLQLFSFHVSFKPINLVAQFKAELRTRSPLTLLLLLKLQWLNAEFVLWRMSLYIERYYSGLITLSFHKVTLASNVQSGSSGLVTVSLNGESHRWQLWMYHSVRWIY